MNATAQDKTSGARVTDVVNRAKSNGRGKGGDPEKRKAAKAIARDKVNKIKERRKGSTPAEGGGVAQSSPAQKDAERRVGPSGSASPSKGGSGEKPAPGGPASGPMAEQASKREDFKVRMMERRASREREKGEPPEDRGQGRGRGR